MSKLESTELKRQIQLHVTELLSLIDIERKQLKNSLNQELEALKKDYFEIEKPLNEVKRKRKALAEEICQKYGHVCKITVQNRRNLHTPLGIVQEGDVIKQCVCCGEIIYHHLMTPCPKNDAIETIPNEMEKDIEKILNPIDKQIAEYTCKLSDINNQIVSIKNRYYTEICQIYGHPKCAYSSKSSVCPCCGKTIDENDLNFLENLLSKLVNN